ncbi:hypothetical protein ACOSQ2_009367 [Xanthoceras sorbifolium]
MRCPEENWKGGSARMLGTTHGVLPCVDTTGESEVGPNSIIKLSEVVRDTKIAAESDSTLLETQVLSIGCVAMVKAQGAADIRPAKQIEVVDEMGLIDCNIVNGLDERSSFLLEENSAIDGLGESSGASLGDSMVCVESPCKPKTRRWKKIVRPVKKYPSPIQKILTLRQNFRRGSKSPSHGAIGRTKRRLSPISQEDNGGKK